MDNAFEVGGGAGVIPGGVWVDDGDGATGADAEAVGLGTMDEGLGAAELELVEAVFEEFPRGGSFGGGAAFFLSGGGTEEDVLFVAVEVEGLGGGFEKVGHGFLVGVFGLPWSSGWGVVFEVIADGGDDGGGDGLAGFDSVFRA